MANRNRSANQLVSFLKRTTRNSNLANSNGEPIEAISQDDLLQYLNEGKKLIQWAVANACPWAFRSFVTEQITERLLEYPMPVNALFGDRLYRLDYARTNANDQFRTLQKGDPRKSYYSEGEPYFYYHNGSNLIIEPAPETGYYRFLIQRQDDILDVRRAMVDGTPATSGGELDSITIDINAAPYDSINREALEEAEWICVCDFEGTVGVYNIPVESYNSATGVITVRDGFDYTSGISDGDYITIGKYSSSHSTLPDGFEDYFLTYAKYRTLNWDSNSDKIEEIPVLQTMKAALIEGIAENIGDEPILTDGILTGNWFDK
jgi:hypothetical protein